LIIPSGFIAPLAYFPRQAVMLQGCGNVAFNQFTTAIFRGNDCEGIPLFGDAAKYPCSGRQTG
jgi:hypothetical protein